MGSHSYFQLKMSLQYTQKTHFIYYAIAIET